AVVTQNTGGLHRDAGSRRVIELRGTGRTVQCLDCGVAESRGDVQARLADEMPPRCAVCGGTFMKPTVVFFGEQMPADAVAQAFELARDADLMLVVGSSLVVFPAAEVPLVASRAGVPIVLINADVHALRSARSLSSSSSRGLPKRAAPGGADVRLMPIPTTAFPRLTSTRIPPSLRPRSIRSFGHLSLTSGPHASAAPTP